MSAPLVTSVAPGSPAAQAGIVPGDEVLRLNGQVPRDVIEWRMLVDEPELEIEVRRPVPVAVAAAFAKGRPHYVAGTFAAGGG